MKIALLGANGQLGHDLEPALQAHEIIPLTRRDVDVADFDRTRRLLMDLSPHVILNTTAYHRVDDCENQPELAFQVNALAVLNLVRIANDSDAVLLHISTDYVFDGNTREPYTESSQPLPLSVYATSKLSGEFLVRAAAQKYFLIRTCGLYGVAGSHGKGGNFVETQIAKAKRRVIPCLILLLPLDLLGAIGILLAQIFPSSQRRGGAKREPDRAKPQKKPRRGGQFGVNVSAGLTTPSAPSAQTPLLCEEGNV